MIAKEALALMEQINNLKYKPNDWELGFLQSILTLAKNNVNTPLSYKQSNAMNAIYCKAAGGGNYQNKQYGYRRP